MEARRTLFRTIIGRTFTGASAYFHTMNGERRAHDVNQIWLAFDQTLGIHLRPAGDGASLHGNTNRPQPVDMEEWGEVRMENLETKPPFAACVGLSVIGVNALVVDGIDFGVEIIFQSTKLIAFNWGDQLYTENNLDAEFLRGETISRVSL